MSNNFVCEGNLSGDAVLDGVAQKVFFESVKIGTGSPSAAPSPASKVWLYADRSQNPAIMWLWDPSTATWHITGDGTGTGTVDSVNGQTGTVVLDHTDVGAEEAGAVADLAATLATVATSGDYDDLINKPTIPDISNLVEDTDPRLSDARTPTAHTHPQSDVTGLVSDLAAKVADTDPRLSDARTPLTHTHPVAQVSASAIAPGSGVNMLTVDTSGMIGSQAVPTAWNSKWGPVGHWSSTSMVQALSSTTADVTGASVSFVAIAGRRYRCSWQGANYDSGGEGVVRHFITDGSNNVLAVVRGCSTAAHREASVSVTTPPLTFTPGPQTVKVRANTYVSTGVSNMWASPGEQTAVLIVEDDGPA